GYANRRACCPFSRRRGIPGSPESASLRRLTWSLGLGPWFLVRPWSVVRPSSLVRPWSEVLGPKPKPVVARSEDDGLGTQDGLRTVGRTKAKEPSTKD